MCIAIASVNATLQAGIVGNDYAFALAAARAIADLSPAKRDADANLLPRLVELRKLSFHVALAVAKKAQGEGLADARSDEASTAAIRAKMWEPRYASYRRRPG